MLTRSVFVSDAAHLEPGYRSAVQESALVVSLQMFNLILEKCVSLLREQLEHPTDSQSSRLIVSEDMQVLLPAVKVTLTVFIIANATCSLYTTLTMFIKTLDGLHYSELDTFY